MPIGPTKVKACNSVLFTEGTPVIEISLMFVGVVTLMFMGLVNFNVGRCGQGLDKVKVG